MSLERHFRFGCLTVAALCAFVASGCASHQLHDPPPGPLPAVGGDVPRELSKVVLPTYVIEPPDILTIEAISLVPRAPYHLRVSDVLGIEVQGTLPDAPILGQYPIDPGGTVNLGMPYGSVDIRGRTVDEAREVIETKLRDVLSEPLVSVSLTQMSGLQQVAGPHLVGPDGTVTLGTYGSVPVVGLTLAQAKLALEQYLSQYLDEPEIAVDVFSYNSKVYYVVTQGAGLGDTVTRFPVTGNETVLDAISNVNGLTGVSSKRIWIARPTPVPGEVQILPVDWNAITGLGTPATNYQVMPGDRIFIAEDKWIAFDNNFGKILAPFERAMGFSLLGVNTVTRFSGNVLGGGGNAFQSGSGGVIFP